MGLLALVAWVRPAPAMGLLQTAVMTAVVVLIWTAYGYRFVVRPEHKASFTAALQRKLPWVGGRKTV